MTLIGKNFFLKTLAAFLLLLGQIALVCSSNEAFHYHCIDRTGQITLCPGNRRPKDFGGGSDERHPVVVVAYSKYSNRMNETGWAEFELVTNGALDDSEQAYFGGLLEGSVTAEMIDDCRVNFLDNDLDGTKYCKPYEQFIGDNLKATIERVKSNPNDRYWQQVGTILYQIAGMETGFNRFLKKKVGNFQEPHLNIEPCGIFLLNLLPELYEIGEIIKTTTQQQDTSDLVLEPMDRCSALIKVLPNAEDILVSHSTWASLNTMIRIMKRYSINLKHSPVKTMVMSSYPGLVTSSDDFYQTDQQMVIQETTYPNFNKKLYDGLKPENVVFDFIRTMVANRLAVNGSEWTRIFSKYNSGTYNNQYMVVDFKRFPKPGHIEPGLLTILEQLPYKIVSDDMTQLLLDQTYWPSFNVPFFKQIYKLSHFEQHYRMVRIERYSYDQNPRARIFARDHSKVTDLKSLFSLMRYNDFRNDPISHCNCTPPYTGEYAIAARCDLNDPTGNYSDPHLALLPLAAIDAKLTSSKLVHQMEFVAVSGPTDQNIEPFVWSTSKVSNLVYHRGQPDRWTFKPVLASWNNHTGVFQQYRF